MGGSAALLVVLSVLGYVLLRHACHRTAKRWQALEWQQNLFESSAAGISFYALALAALEVIGPLSGDVYFFSHGRLSYFARVLAIPHAAPLAMALALGLMFSAIANLVWSKDLSLVLAVRSYGGSMRVMLHEAHREARPVLLSLMSRKVYVGWVASPPALHEKDSVVLLPTLSGVRDPDALNIRWTTNYSPVYEDLIARDRRGEALTTGVEHFQLVIPLETVSSATYFDRDIYERHFAEQRVTKPPQG